MAELRCRLRWATTLFRNADGGREASDGRLALPSVVASGVLDERRRSPRSVRWRYFAAVRGGRPTRQFLNVTEPCPAATKERRGLSMERSDCCRRGRAPSGFSSGE